MLHGRVDLISSVQQLICLADKEPSRVLDVRGCLLRVDHTSLSLEATRFLWSLVWLYSTRLAARSFVALS
jgi:hypothetical protein